MVGLGDLSGGTFDSRANAVSDNGGLVVGSGTSASGTEAFTWSARWGMVGLGDLGGGSFSSVAYGVSADGQVVVGEGSSSSGKEAFRWTSGGGMVGLGDLPGGLFSSKAKGASADGSVVVGSGTSASGVEAFRWTSGAGMVSLGDLPGGAVTGTASGVSADGSVVVGRGHSDSGFEAFIWDAGNGMRSIQGMLATEYGVGVIGWNLTEATAVCANGRAIVGWGVNPSGDTEAWLVLLDPLEVHWINASGGDWDTRTNWDWYHPATGVTDVYIQPEYGLTVQGPGSTTEIKSLTVGAATAGTATLSLRETGLLSVSGKIQIEAGGRITGSGTLASPTRIDNFGEIDLDGGLQVTGTLLYNFGLVHGSGQIDNQVTNLATGVLRSASGGRMLLTGPNNANDGQMHLEGGTVEVTQGLVNSGQVHLLGGTLDVGQGLLNAAVGFIAGRGTLRTGDGTTNYGTMAFSGGFTDVHGDVTNDPGARIVISGGGTTTFYDDVASDGEIRVSAGCSAVFFGALSGTGGTTGTGTVYIEGDLKPGSSPGALFFGGDVVFGPWAALEAELGGTMPGEFDTVHVAGQAVLGGTLALLTDGYAPGPGDEVRIMTYASHAGEFDRVVGPPGAVFDVDYGAAGVTVTFVPEPAALALVAAGGVGLLVRRRRRAAAWRARRPGKVAARQP